MMDINGLASMVHKCFDKKSLDGAVTRVDVSPIKSEIMTSKRPSDLSRVAKVSDCKYTFF